MEHVNTSTLCMRTVWVYSFLWQRKFLQEVLSLETNFNYTYFKKNNSKNRLL